MSEVHEIDVLRRQVKSLRREVRQLTQWQYVIGESPFWKRPVWWLKGYRFQRLGVWYRAGWNRDGWEY